MGRKRRPTDQPQAITARSEQHTLIPAAHIKELKERSHPIRTQRISITGDQGRSCHGIAPYYLTQSVE